MSFSDEERTSMEDRIRGMSWKTRMRTLLATVEQYHEPSELPPNIRRWLEFNRSAPADSGQLASDLEDLRATLQLEVGWFRDRVEILPISGWIVSLTHVLKDGVRWWLLNASRHDDSAPLIGPRVPAPATHADLRRLSKLVAFAGGNPDRELLRTGAITEADRAQYLADGKPEIAEYGQVFYWWRA